MAVARSHRFSAERPCPICGGYDRAPRGKGIRCYGFLGTDGKYAHCTREEFAGDLRAEPGDTYAHRLEGECRCGSEHGNHGNQSTDPVAETGSRRVIAETFYDYDGGLRVVRKDFSDGTKTFTQWHRNGAGFLSGRGDAPLTLYRAPELAGAPPEAFVFLVEGEKCVDALRLQGLTAVTTPGGASNFGGTAKRAAELLKGRHVVILPDHDPPGAKYASAARATLEPISKSLRVVELPGLEDGDDVIDWLRRGGEPEELVRIALDAPNLAPETEILFVADQIRRIWPVPLPVPVRTGLATLDRLTGGLRAESVTVLNGPPGKGKSGLALQIGRYIARSDDVLYISSELSGRQAMARLVAQERRESWIDVYETGPSETETLAAALEGLRIHVRELRRGDVFLELLARICEALGHAPLLVLDYLQHAARRLNPTEPRFATALLSDSISLWTKETKAPALIVSGVARVNYHQDADRHGVDLQGSGKDSGEIDYDAAVDMLLLSDGERARLEVTKNRFGLPGTIGLHFDGRVGTFTEDLSATLSDLDRDILRAIHNGAQTANEVMQRVKMRRAQCLAAISRMVYAGIIERCPLRVVNNSFALGGLNDE